MHKTHSSIFVFCLFVLFVLCAGAQQPESLLIGPGDMLHAPLH